MPERQQRVLQPVRQRLLKLALRARSDSARWWNTYGSRTSCCASSESGVGSASAKFDGAGPTRSTSRV